MEFYSAFNINSGSVLGATGLCTVLLCAKHLTCILSFNPNKPLNETYNFFAILEIRGLRLGDLRCPAQRLKVEVVEAD